MNYRTCFLLVGLLIAYLFIGFSIPSNAEDTVTVPKFLKEQEYNEPLQFVEISIRDVKKHSAVIEWETNHPASGRIEVQSQHDKSRQYSRVSSLKNHSIPLDDLIEGTVYRFRVYSWDNSGHRIKSQLIKFRTQGTPPPRLKRLYLKERSLSGGIIRWVTNIPTKAVFRSGYDTPYQYTTRHNKLTRYHEVRLDHFHPNQKIKYRITITDSRGRKRIAEKSFKTRENNVAWNKPVKGTFDKPIYGIPSELTGKTPFIERVNDDNYDYQYGTANSGDPSDTNQWFTVNLKELVGPDTAVLVWRSFAYPKNYKILGSKLGRNWDVLADDLNAKNGQKTRKGGIPSFKQVVDLSKTDHTYQLIKVLIPKGSGYYGKYPSYEFVQLQEFKLFPREKYMTRPNFNQSSGGGRD